MNLNNKDHVKIITDNMAEALRKYLIENKEEDERHLKTLQYEFEKLFIADFEFIGRVLKCHLIIEKYLNDCFNHHYGKSSNFEKANLRFHQKLTLLKNKSTYLSIFSAGFEKINNIRNKLAHNLNIKFSIEDVRVMKLWADVASIFLKINPNDVIEVIEAFTIISCCSLADEISERGQDRSQEISKLMDDVFEKLREQGIL